jgi:hypothetical protein
LPLLTQDRFQPADWDAGALASPLFDKTEDEWFFHGVRDQPPRKWTSPSSDLE